MAGWITAGLPQVGPASQNGVVQTAPAGQYPMLSPRAFVAADTEAAAGQAPQSVAATVAQIAMLAVAMAHNQQTSTAGAATSSTTSGSIITEALTTAAGATYTMTLTNTLVTAAGAPLLVDIRSGSNTTPGMTLTSVTNGSGSSVFVFTNQGAAALNGTMVIGWSL